MSTIHQARRLVFGFGTVFALTLLAPVPVTAQDDVTALAPVSAAPADDTNVEDVWATRALAAQRALLSEDIGSLQEEHLFAIVAAAPSSEELRVLTAQQALLSRDLGSMQEDALTAIVAARSAEVAS